MFFVSFSEVYLGKNNPKSIKEPVFGTFGFNTLRLFPITLKVSLGQVSINQLVSSSCFAGVGPPRHPQAQRDHTSKYLVNGHLDQPK